MIKSKNNIFYIATLLFGSVVGAGFASGKELLFYFAQYGAACIPFIVLAIFLFCWLGYVFLTLGKKFNLKSVQQTSHILFGKFAYAAELTMLFGNLVLLSSMLAGSNSMFDILFPGIPYGLIALITAAVCLVIVLSGFEWLVRINAFVVPIMLVLIIGLFIFSLTSPTLALTFPVIASPALNTLFAFTGSILFVCGNMFFVGFVVAKYGSECTGKQIFWGSCLASVFLMVCIIAEVFTIFLNGESAASDMPLVFVASTAGTTFKYLSLAGVWISILTTATVMHYTISNWLRKYIKNKYLSTSIVILAAFGLSFFGFSNIVSILYPILGAFGVIFAITAMIKIRKPKKPGIENKKK